LRPILCWSRLGKSRSKTDRAEDLEEELVEGQMALPDDLLVFLDATEIQDPDSLSLVAAS
jgi:hypothetical protein